MNLQLEKMASTTTHSSTLFAQQTNSFRVTHYAMSYFCPRFTRLPRRLALLQIKSDFVSHKKQNRSVHFFVSPHFTALFHVSLYSHLCQVLGTCLAHTSFHASILVHLFSAASSPLALLTLALRWHFALRHHSLPLFFCLPVSLASSCLLHPLPWFSCVVHMSILSHGFTLLV